MGHFRDLPKSTIGINYDKNFLPDYIIVKNKEKIVDQLKKLAEDNGEIILATDLDREGESISYHIAFVLNYIKENWPEFEFATKIPLKRIVFHKLIYSLDDVVQLLSI